MSADGRNFIRKTMTMPTPEHERWRNAEAAGLVARGDGGGDDGDMEARIAKLEASMEHVQEDIRDIKADLRGFRDQVHDDFKSDRSTARAEFLWLVGGAIAAVTVLVGVMAHGFHWI